MDLLELFGADLICKSLRLWTFATQEPQFLEFLKLRGGGFLVGGEMKKVTARREIGVLKVTELPAKPPSNTVIHVLSRRARILTGVILAAPDSFERAAVRLKLDIGELSIAAGVTPGTVCVRLGSRQWGSPEFDWADYVRTHV